MDFKMVEKTPILCAKCKHLQYHTDEEFEEMDLIKCQGCGFLYKNPCKMNSMEEIMENIQKARDC